MWPWTALMYLVGTGKFSNFTFLSFTELLLFTFPLNFYLYGLNDIYDVKSDRINERKDGAQGIVVQDSEIDLLKQLVWIPPAFFFLVSLFSQNIEHILLAFGFILLSFTYSYRKIRFKEIPVLDCFNSAAIYLIPGLIAYSLRASITTLPLELFLLILPYAGVHAVTTLVDEVVDRRAGMITIGVVFGKRGTLLFSLLTFFAALYIFRDSSFFVSLLTVSIFLQAVTLFAGKKDDERFRFALGSVVLSFGMFALLYFVLQANLF